MADFNLKLYSDTVAKNLFETNEWYNNLKNFDRWVYANSIIIPQDGAASTPVELDGTTVLPIATVKKTLADHVIPIVKLGAEPRYVNLDQDELSNADMIQSTLESMTGELKQGINIRMAYGLQPATASLSTSGTATRTNFYGQAAVKELTIEDVSKARTILAKQKCDMSKLFLLVDSVMANDLRKQKANGFVPVSEMADKVLEDGVIGTLLGIKVVERTLGLAYTGAGAKPTVNYSDAYDNTHFSSALLYDASKVGKGKSPVRVGIEDFATGYYTDVMQAATRCASGTEYASGIGVVSIIEAV